ncbi:disease resistance protein RPP2B-like [Rosa rugosa]|uniref:disease resistance protein RPP2B-like n=1 Tax=Rosa rugosa TaxID=74645 RepID=UPI002B40169F|nr:disease resistance protein RPP2B-like [Rosa rugosa]XP_062000464.1 disease resistance protein RPP2B-like [Rosa rugosa]
MIQTINPTIKQASGLKYLNTSNCKCLQSLPELPCLPTLVANGCPSLKTVSYPMTAPRRDLNQRHSFCACINLDENTRSNMMHDAWAAWLRIVRMATDHPLYGTVTLICPGTEIPKWFSCEKEGSSIKTKLPQQWSDDKNFLRFALSAVLPFYTAYSVTLQCECNLTTNNERSHQLTLFHSHSHKARIDGLEDEHSDHLLMVYRSLSLPDTVKWSTEVFFDFSAKLDGQFVEVKSCGVLFLYAQGQDHDSLKFEVIDTEQATWNWNFQ